MEKPRSPRERSIAHTIRKFNKRRLHSGQGKNKGRPPKGPLVMRRRHAIAIALSIANRKFGPYIPKTQRGLEGKILRD
jgi:hypothetical protein